MNRSVRATLATLVLLSASAVCWPDGAITKILIDPMDHGTSVDITNRQLLDRFTVWSGPGAGWSSNRTPDPREPVSFIDWTNDRVTELPKKLSRYKVTVYVDDRELPSNTYEVVYATNGPGHGYIYLPGSAMISAAGTQS